jgi:capsular polysaccharide transport system permease protein
MRRSARRLLRVNKLFLLTVLIPTTVATLYFAFLANDVYVSESEFVVRKPQQQTMTGLGSLLQSTGLSQGSEDVYSVQEFLSSRDALEKLDQQFALRRSYGSAKIDWLHRFSSVDGDQSFEALLRYYKRHVVETDLDTSSSILTLTVRAFSADEAYRMNEALLEMSEDLVNRMNQRSRDDLVKLASADVELAERQAKSAVEAVSSFRNGNSLFDPERQSGLQLETIGKLQEELIATQNQIADVKAVAGRNPQIPVLQNRTDVLQGAIDAETAKVAGDNQSLSTKSADYDGVMLERDFAAKRLELALMSLQTAREDALKQQLYLERIAQPNKPDVAIEPKRVRNIVATFVLGLIGWGILSLLLAAVKEHAE